MSSPSARTPDPTPAGPAATAAPAVPWWRRPVVWVVAAVVVAVAVAVGVGLARSGADPSAAPPASSDPSTQPTAEPSEEPGEEPSGEPTEPAGTEEPGDGGTPAPEPGEGEPAPRPTADPVPLDEPAQPEASVSVVLDRVEEVEGEANLPGEVGGPSLRVTVTVENGTDAELDLTSAVVNLYHGADRAPAIPLLQPGHEDFPTSMAAGERASGVFVFNVPEDRRDDVLVEFDLSSGSTVVLFQGAV